MPWQTQCQPETEHSDSQTYWDPFNIFSKIFLENGLYFRRYNSEEINFSIWHEI